MANIGTPSALTSGGTSNATSAVSASISPATDELIMVVVFNKGPNSVAANPPNISGLSISWYLVANHVSSFSAGEWRMAIFVGVVTSPTSGAVTMDYSGQSQQSILWGIIQFPNNVKLNLSNPQNSIIQSGVAENNSTISSMGVSLGSFANEINATIGAWADDGQAAFTGATGQTTILNISPASGNLLITFNQANQTTMTANFAANNATGKIALAAEIAAAPSGGAFVFNMLNN